MDPFTDTERSHIDTNNASMSLVNAKRQDVLMGWVSLTLVKSKKYPINYSD